MKRIIAIITLITVYSITPVVAQNDFRDGYVVTINNDTIQGTISYVEGSQPTDVCRFKKNGSSDIISYTPIELQGYRFKDDKYFISIAMPPNSEEATREFVEVLVSGAATLYMINNEYYIKKGDSGLQSLTNEKTKVINENDGKEYYKYSNLYIGKLTFLLNDCNSINSKIQQLKLREKPLTDLIEEYNNCVNSKSITYKAQKPWLKGSLGVVAGVNFSSFKIDSYLSEFQHLNGEYSGSTSPIFGISLDLSSPRINKQYSLRIDALYTTSKYSINTVQDGSGTTVKNDIDFEFNELIIPLSFRYSLRERKITPYFEFGFSGTIHLSSDAKWIRETTNNSGTTTEEREAMDVSNGQIGLWAGVGIKSRLSKKLNGYIETRIGKTSGVSKTVNIDSDITNFQILIGISR